MARSTFPSQNTPGPDHFWQLRCRKSARRCGAKHISKSKCTKHTILGPLLEVEMLKKCTPLWREAHFQVKMYKTHHVRTIFGGSDVEKVHAVVARSTFPSQNYKTHHARTIFGGSDVEKVHAGAARSTFPSQNVQNTPCTDHFWRFRCRKSGRRCGAKHISKSKCTKHTMYGPLLKVEMLKKCTPLWREAHFQVKMYKTHHVRTIFGGSDVEKVDAGVARSTFPSQNVQNTPCTDHFWRFRCSFAWQAQRIVDLVKSAAKREGFVAFSTTTTTTLHDTPIHYTTLQLQLHFHYNTPLHYTALKYTQHTTLHYTTFHYTTSHYTTLHYTTLHYITLQLQLHNYTPLHSTTLHRHAKLHYTSLHYTTLHSTTLQLQLHSTTLHYTRLH